MSSDFSLVSGSSDGHWEIVFFPLYISFDIHLKIVCFFVCICMQGHPCVIESRMELLKSITAVICCLDTKPQSPFWVILRIRKSRFCFIVDFIKKHNKRIYICINLYTYECVCYSVTI